MTVCCYEKNDPFIYMKDHPQIYKVQGGLHLQKNLCFSLISRSYLLGSGYPILHVIRGHNLSFFYRMYVYGHDIKGLGSVCPGESKEAPDGYKSIVGGK